MTRQKFFLTSLFALFACAPAPAAIHEVQDFQGTFVCDDKQSLKMRFAPFKATMDLQSGPVDLTQQPIAKGFLYTGAGQTLQTSGSDVIWTDDKGAGRHCRDSRVAGPKD